MKKNLLIELYKTIFLIREAEKKIVDLYHEDEMKTPMHMSMGEEAVIAGVVEAISKTGQFFGYYRSHALFLAVTKSPYKFFMELYGKTNGVVGGRGGSMHLSSPKDDLLVVSAIVSSSISPALGAAYANKYLLNGKISVVFFGDGALEEGVVHECFNFASLKKLPLIFVCLDNQLAVDVLPDKRHGFKSIHKFIDSYNINYLSSSSNNVYDIYKLTIKAINHIKNDQKPVFMHLHYYRQLQHIGIKNDFDNQDSSFERKNYRSLIEHNIALENDPVTFFRSFIITKKNIDEKRIIEFEDTIRSSINEAIISSKKADFPEPDSILNYVT